MSGAVILSFLTLAGCSPDTTAPADAASTSIADLAFGTSERTLDVPAGTGQTIPRVHFSRVPLQPNVTDVEFYDPSLAMFGGVPLSVTLGVRGSAAVEYKVIRSGASRYRVQAKGHFIDDWQGEIVSIRIEYGERGGQPVRSTAFDVYVLKNGDAPLQDPRLSNLRSINDASKSNVNIIRRVTVSNDPAGQVESVQLDIKTIDGPSAALTIETLPTTGRLRGMRDYQWRISSAELPDGAVYLLTVTMVDRDGKPVGAPLFHVTDLKDPSDPWLASLDGQLVLDEKQRWSLVVSVEPRKGLGRSSKKISGVAGAIKGIVGTMRGIAGSVAPKPDVFELEASGTDSEGRLLYRFSGLEFSKDPRGSFYQVDLEFTLSQPGGRAETKVRYGQCWVFAATVTSAS
jgi:hypothetical protein